MCRLKNLEDCEDYLFSRYHCWHQIQLAMDSMTAKLHWVAEFAAVDGANADLVILNRQKARNSLYVLMES